MGTYTAYTFGHKGNSPNNTRSHTGTRDEVHTPRTHHKRTSKQTTSVQKLTEPLRNGMRTIPPHAHTHPYIASQQHTQIYTHTHTPGARTNPQKAKPTRQATKTNTDTHTHRHIHTLTHPHTHTVLTHDIHRPHTVMGSMRRKQFLEQHTP